MSRRNTIALIFITLILASTASAVAQEAEVATELRGGLSVLDWIVVGGYALGMLAVGFYYAYKTKTSEDYYLGGRKMSPTMVGLSLFATLLSTITYLSLPGEMIKHGPMVLTALLAIPIIYLIVGYFMIPYIMKLPITSGYELLEMRLGRPVRLFGSAIFIMIRLVWMGLVVYITGQIVVRAIGLDPAYVKYAVITLGVVTVVYSSMGGLQAVVLTDVIQTVILFVGALLAIALVSFKMGGVGWFPTQWAPTWDTQPLFSLDPRVRVTVFWAIVNITCWWVCTAASDQMAIQRYLATRDAKTARKVFLVNHVAGALVQIVLAILGFALLGFFTANPQHLTEELNLQNNTDYLFPQFVIKFFGFGLAGLVISGMLAAAMSSLSSGVNSVCTVINADMIEHLFERGLSEEVKTRRTKWMAIFLRIPVETLARLFEEGLSEKDKIRLARWVSLAVGAIVIAVGFSMGNVPGNIQEVTAKTNGLFVVPLFGLFFLAMFVPFATSYGAVFGSLYGFLAAFLVAFWEFTGGPALSFQWILAVSLVVNIAVGCALSQVPWKGTSRTHKVVLSIAASIPLAAATIAYIAACIAANGAAD